MQIEQSQLRRGQFFFLASRAPDRMFLAILAGVVGGLAYSALIPLILMSIAPLDPLLAELAETNKVMVWNWEVQHPKFAAAFLILCAFVVLSKAFAQIVFGQILVRSAGELRLFFADRIRQLPIADLEAVGSMRLVSAITIDVTKMLEGAANLPVLVINAATIAGALAFIAFLHSGVFWLVLGVIVFGIVTYRLPLVLGQRYFSHARETRDQVQDSIRAQVYGAKELKLNPRKYEAFMESGMRMQERAVMRLLNMGNAVVYLAIQYGNMVGFLAIGAIAFGATNLYELPTDMLVAIVMAMLYIIGPIGIIVNAAPALLQGAVAMNKLCELLKDMPVEDLAEAGAPLACAVLELDQVVYSYRQRDGFAVGPLNLTLRRGQVTFIVGGNGSGKSTLAKLLSCHYLPDAGRILYDGRALDRDTLGGARQTVSAIYLDFYLFSHLFGHDAADLEPARGYLAKLGLAHKVTLDGGRFSTTELSAGQRKRLALLVAYLEDRNLYIFDEWAADQDPEFKHVFYTEILPEFRRQGKIVVVISHDDKYFNQADQRVWMEHGQISRIECRASGTFPPAANEDDAPTFSGALT